MLVEKQKTFQGEWLFIGGLGWFLNVYNKDKILKL